MTSTIDPQRSESKRRRRNGIGRILTAKQPTDRFRDLDPRTRRFFAGGLVTLFTTAVLGVYLLPFGYMLTTSVKSEEQIARSTVLPKSAQVFEYAAAPFDLIEVDGPDGSPQAVTLLPAGLGGDSAMPYLWDGDWDEFLDLLAAGGTDASSYEIYSAGSGGRSERGLSFLLPDGDPSLLIAGQGPEPLEFDGTEPSLIAGLEQTGYSIGEVALFAMPTVDDEVTAIALLRPGAAIDALINPALLPSKLVWDGTFAGLADAASNALGVDLGDTQFLTVPDADGSMNGVGFVLPDADATVLLDPATALPEPLDPVTSAVDLADQLDATFNVSVQELELRSVPLADGTERDLALLSPGPTSSTFIDPQNPLAEPIVWEGRAQTLEPILEFDPTLQNFPDAFDRIGFAQKIRNTAIIAGLGMGATVLSSTFVAYGLSRFRIPFKSLIFSSLVATIILPRFVTLVPTYMVFERIGWVGTWWPLIVPHLFANAYNVFLLRQFFLTIPRDLDEAASIDGAGPFMTLVTVILPQAKGAILAVALFHFFFAWNDFLEPLLYLSTQPDKQPISIGLYFFLGLYDSNIPLIQAGALLGMAIPILVYLALQKVFLDGIDLSGSMK